MDEQIQKNKLFHMDLMRIFKKIPTNTYGKCINFLVFQSRKHFKVRQNSNKLISF